jgi:hypothetical protein
MCLGCINITHGVYYYAGRSHWSRRLAVCGRSLAGIVGPNPPRAWMSVCFECCVLSGRGLLVWADHPSRGVLPSVVCLSKIVKPREWGGPGTLGAVAPWKRYTSVIHNLLRSKSYVETNIMLFSVWDVAVSTTVTEIQPLFWGNVAERLFCSSFKHDWCDRPSDHWLTGNADLLAVPMLSQNVWIWLCTMRIQDYQIWKVKLPFQKI